MAPSELWGYGEPPEPTALERLAHEANLGERELRRLLAAEIQRRRRERGHAWDALEVSLSKREHRRLR